MKITEDIHKLLDRRAVILLGQHSIKTLTQLMSTKPEKLSSILAMSYTAVCQMRRDLFSEHASFPTIGLECYQSLLEREVMVSTGSDNLDTMLAGGLKGGQVYEVYGYPGTGKTQLCLTAAATCLKSGGSVVFIDTKGDFCLDRMMEILRQWCGDVDPAVLDRMRVCSAVSAHSLLQSVTMIVRTMSNVSLVLVDNVCVPVMRLVTHDNVRSSVSIGAKVSQCLHQLAARGAAVLIVNNVKGVSGEQTTTSHVTSVSPALGTVWNTTANTRLLLTRESDENVSVSFMRGINSGDKCTVTFSSKGVS